VIEVGKRLPPADVWTAPRERTDIHGLLADGPALFLFYLFDWSST
jgi:hypothetical protein